MAAWVQGFGSSLDGGDFLSLQRAGATADRPTPKNLKDFSNGFGTTFEGRDFLTLQGGGAEALAAAPTSAAEFAAGFGTLYDGADLLGWQREYSGATAMPAAISSTTSGDFNTDGIVDGHDLQAWQASFGQSVEAAVVDPGVTGTGYYGSVAFLHTFNILAGPDQVINVANGVTSASRRFQGSVIGPTSVFIGHGDVSLSIVVNGSDIRFNDAFEASASGATILWGTGANGSSPVEVAFGAGRSTIEYKVHRTSTSQTADVFANTSLTGPKLSGTVAVNRIPEAVDDALSLASNEARSLKLLSNDRDDDQLLPAGVRADDPLRVTRVLAGGLDHRVGSEIILPSGAKLTVAADGTADYDPRSATEFLKLKAGETKADSFVYEITDGYMTRQATVAITVTGVNDPPVLVASQVSKKAGQGGEASFSIADQFVDPEGDEIRVIATSLSTPQFGQLSVSADGRTITYKQTSATPTDDEFTYQVSDNVNTSAVATAVVSVVELPAILEFNDDVAPIVGPVASGGATNDAQPVLRGTAEPGAMVTVDGLPPSITPVAVVADPLGNWQIAVSDALADGNYTLRARAVTANLPGEPITLLGAPFEITVDRQKPTLTALGASLPSLRNSAVAEPVVIAFSESVAGLDLSDFTLTLDGGANLLPGSAAQVAPVGGGSRSAQWQLSGLADLTNATGVYTLTVRGAGSAIVDQAGNELSVGGTLRFAVDAARPLATAALSTGADAARASTPLSTPVVDVSDPSKRLLDVTVTDQTFAGIDNAVAVELTVSRVRPDGTTTTHTLPARSVSFAAGSATISGQKTLSYTVAELGSTGPGFYSITAKLTDGAGNATASALAFQFDVAGASAPTQSAPGTPVHSEAFFIGARIKREPANPTANDQIVVDQPIPEDYTVIVNGTIYRVSAAVRVSDAPGGAQRYRLTLRTPSGGSPNLAALPADTKVAWLRPWQTSLDKTTQTIWFTLEDGHQLGHFDPATGHLKLYDVSIPIVDDHGEAMRLAFDPHGAFFDFDSHLTPRVWLVYRNTRGGGGDGTQDNDTPGPTMDHERIARVSYFDLVQKRLFTYDFGGEQMHGGAHSTVHGDTVMTPHAVFVDALGDVWISAGHSRQIVQLDFDRDVNGNPLKLNSTVGRAIVHTLPEGLGFRGATNLHFEAHGVQVVVDERSGQQYVFVVDAQQSGRIAMLLPATAETPGDPKSAPTTDRWFEWNFDALLEFEGRTSPHVLFTSLDDNETPGIPEDDHLVIGDTGRGFRGGGDGVLRRIDIGTLIASLQTPSPTRPNTPIIKTAQPDKFAVRVESIHVVKALSAVGEFSAPIQTFVDRGGTIFAVDGVGGVMRVDFDEVLGSDPVDPKTGTGSTSSPTTMLVDVVRFEPPSPPKVTAIDMTPTTEGVMPPFWDVYLSPELLTDDGSVTAGIPRDMLGTTDLSLAPGVDQYVVGAPIIRRGGGADVQGAGPFRGAINATSVLYGAISQSDHLSTTVFAETARRQMVAIPSPTAGELPLRGRMVFQTLRDGSVVLTARADGIILDVQKSLTQILTKAKSLSLNSIALASEPTAVLGSDGLYVFGVTPTGTLLTLKYTGAWNSTEAMFDATNWQVGAQTPAPAAEDGMIAGAPTAVAEAGGRVAVFVTTGSGRLLRYYAGDAAFTDLTDGNAGMEIYASPGVVQVGSVMYVYGSNQKGELVEYSYTVGGAAGAAAVKRTTAPARDVRVFQDIEAVASGGVRHVYGTDGNSRLVHIEITAAGIVTAENVSQIVADTLKDNDTSLDATTGVQSNVDVLGNDQAFGFFPYQNESVGRVYSGLEVLVDANGRQFIYGTNGANLILFIRNGSGPTGWRLANLTTDGYSIYGSDRGGPGQAPKSRLPANSVFGAPAGYIEANGDRHIFQINAEGDVVEYYILQGVPIPRFHTQNINLRTGLSTTDLLFPDAET